MLIGLMSLPNQVVYIQFHPVAYMVKLNIEMSMAALITRLAKDKDTSFAFNSLSYSNGNKGSMPTHDGTHNRDTFGLKKLPGSKVDPADDDPDLEAIRNGAPGIHRRLDVEIRADIRKDDEQSEGSFYKAEDEAVLTHHAGHPQPRSLRS